MPRSPRTHPHLRLTAAILVAVLAALASGLDGDPTTRGSRRGELHSVLRLVSLTPDGLDGDGFRVNCSNALHARSAFQHAFLEEVSSHSAFTSDRAPSRAARAERLVASASRACTLRTSALPPPIC